jgi:DNA-binding transcriptional LysR family regulator
VDLARHLRHFLVVAEQLHFGRAAEILGVAQPPLSQSIRRLERELGVSLFDRSRRQVQLTTAGRLLRSEAQQLLASEQRLRALAHRLGDGLAGRLRAGVPPDIPAATLQELVRRLSEHAAELEVDLHERTTAQQLHMLAAGQLDCGLVHHPVAPAALRFGPVVEAPLGVVLPRGSALAERCELALADLAGKDLVVFPRPSAPGWHDHLLEVCRQHGFAPTRLRTASNTEFLLGLVLAGRGVALERLATARREPRLTWRPLTGNPLVVRISGAWNAHTPHPAAPTFATVAAQVLGDDPPLPQAPAPSTPRPWSVVYAPHHTADVPGGTGSAG